MRSDAIKRGPERAPHRALLHAVGVSPSELDRPFIGVANKKLITHHNTPRWESSSWYDLWIDE